jgi:PTH1 family peptidyl-tRNA hydrolase
MKRLLVINIIIGLGNPGKEFEKTYHNLGFLAIDSLAEDFSLNFSKKNKNSIYAEGLVNGKKVILVKPQTYMNHSGEAVAIFKQKYKDANLIILCDDIDLPKGKVRYRERGSAGTHNGLRSIVAHIGEEFKRVKIGAGRDEKMDLADYVLSKINDENYLLDAIEKTKKMLIENLI